MKNDTARFSLGCFWEPDIYFSQLPGVLMTTVGYSGGSTKNPIYDNLGDHTETVQIEYDPSLITYEDLLRHFWSQHDPTYRHRTQYRSAIFYLSETQKQQAVQSKRHESEKRGVKIETDIEPAGEFYRAEEYHQKYLQKNPLAAVFC